MSEPKPPLGIMPRWRYEEIRDIERIQELVDAIIRYRKEGVPCPPEWAQEIADLSADQRVTQKITMERIVERMNQHTNQKPSDKLVASDPSYAYLKERLITIRREAWIVLANNGWGNQAHANTARRIYDLAVEVVGKEPRDKS